LALIIISLALNAFFAGAMAASDNGTGSSSAPGANGINDSGFRPEVNGFGFQNYGDDASTVDLTPVEMQRMFGDRVCACLKDGQCTLTNPAKMWMEAAISAMSSGHCEGLAVLSDLIYYSKINPSGFGGPSAIDLSLKNELLQREIGYWWVTQVTNPGGSEKIKDSPNAVLDTLARSFAQGRNANEWWVMGLYLPDGSGGHAITPYAVQDMGNDTFRIMVYDNNWPKDERFVEVNRTTNTWRYQASINPDEQSTLYVGNASTKTLEIVSVSSRLGRQKCEFCDADNNTSSASGAQNATSGSKGSLQVWQNGMARVLVTDDRGRSVGFLDSGKPVNEIPDAEMRNLKFAPNELPMPVIFVPISSDNAAKISVNVSSSANSSAENKSAKVEKNQAKTSIIAPGFAVSSEVEDLQQGQHQSIDLIKEGQEYSLSFSGNIMDSPLIAIGTKLNQITISGLDILPDGMINLSMNPANGTFNMLTGDAGLMQLQMNSTDPMTGELSTFLGSDLSLGCGDGLSLNFANSFEEDGQPSFSIDRANGLNEDIELKETTGTKDLDSPSLNSTNITSDLSLVKTSEDASYGPIDMEGAESYESTGTPGMADGGFKMPSIGF